MTAADQGLLPFDEVFARVKKRVGDARLALRDIKRCLLDGEIVAVVRRVARARSSGDESKPREVPVKFWQTAVPSVYQDRITVRSDEQHSDFYYHYFLRRTDVEKVWPVNSAMSGAANEPQPPWPRKSSAGAKGDYDWEEILIEAARHMWENGVPKSFTELRNHIEEWFVGDAPSETQLREHLRPLYRALKRADGK